MTERDGSKGRASAICIQHEHLAGATLMLPEKTARRCLFQQHCRVTSMAWEDKGPVTDKGPVSGEERS